MITIERRFDVRLISSQMLAQYMKHRGIDVRSLARMVGCSRSTIGALRSGARSYLRPEWAARVEGVLNAPPGSLFVPEISNVSRETARRSA